MYTGEVNEIVIIGAGRLAAHLGKAFLRQGMKVVQVYNRTPGRGRDLANRIGAGFTSEIPEIYLQADLYILAVSDSVLGELASRLTLKNGLVVHTSGTVEMDILSPISENIGVFYPVQTFSQNRRVNFQTIPVCIEGNSDSTLHTLSDFANKLTNRVYILDSDQRRLLHLAAVFSSNFTNLLYAVSEELLLEHDIPFELLKPLILQTSRNVIKGNLVQYQTGPAVREDTKVLEKHREMLSGHPDYLEIYNQMSKNIIKQKKTHGKL